MSVLRDLLKKVSLKGFLFITFPQYCDIPGLFKELRNLLKLESNHVITILQLPYHSSTLSAARYVTSAVLYARSVSYSSLINVTSGTDIILNFAQHLETF